MVVKKGDEKSLEACQMIFLCHLLEITKLDWETCQSVGDKLGVQNVVGKCNDINKSGYST